jgi:hypothetical protein
MIFTTGQWLGIGVFTVAVIVVGALLLKLDSRVGTNYDVGKDEGATSGIASATTQTPPARPQPANPRRKRRH